MTADTQSRLDGVQLLANLSAETLRNMEKRCRWRRYKSEEQILDKDSDDRDVYFVVSGTVQVVNYSMTGREIALARVAAGGFFGELSAIDGQPRSASVVAIAPCLLASLSPRLFIDLLRDSPDLALVVMNKLAAIVRSCDERIMDLSTLGAVQRVYVELLRLAEETGPESGEWAIRNVPTHKVIASRASTTRETVARSMSQLSSGGIIERKGSTLHIRGRDRLEKLAGVLEVEFDGALTR